MNSRPAALLGEVGSNRLRFANVRGLKSLGSTDDIELQPLAFGKRLEALALDRGVVDEYVLATLLLDETKTLCFVEPLHRSVCHLQLLLLAGASPLHHALTSGARPGHLGRASGRRIAQIQQSRRQLPLRREIQTRESSINRQGNCLQSSIGQNTQVRNTNLGFGVTLYAL